MVSEEKILANSIAACKIQFSTLHLRCHSNFSHLNFLCVCRGGEKLMGKSCHIFSSSQGHHLQRALQALRAIRRARISRKLASAGQVLRISRGQHSPTSRHQRFSQAQNWLSNSTRRWISVTARFPLWPRISSLSLHTIHSTLVGSVLHARTGLLP